ncbi:Receptor-binding cancer antigen [Toxocara canis]|uniref:Receptor-binding cancer antigen n=1 Tax=Toxocara canis TaxID=6265 RepID=A0A0B2VG61_TOXCA|nr:Receptor-binding cancer antigen [Toxocara canis]
MSMGTLVMRKIFSLVRIILSCLKRVLCCLKRRRGSETLPFIASRDHPSARYQLDPAESANQWDSWSNKPFTNVVEEKIDEYRRKKMEMMSQQENPPEEPDFFTDMQPNVKRTRKAFVGSTSGSMDAKKENLFAFKDDLVPFTANSNELGDLDETPTNNEDSWDTHIDIDDVDDLLKEQRRRERLEKQRARLAEHERRMAEKRSMHLKIVAVVYYLYIL